MAARKFDDLTTAQRANLAQAVFNTLEFDSEGNPGSEWSSDTLEDLSNVFAMFGVSFTDPTDLWEG